MFGNVTRRGGHTPRVGGRCESDPPGPDPEGTSLRTTRLRLLPLTSRDESDHARASRNAADALRDTRAADVQWRDTASAHGPSGTSRAAVSSAAPSCVSPATASRASPPTKSRRGWWVTEDRRNDGIATEAMEAAIDDLFSRTDVETITAYISDGGNEASAAWQPSWILGTRPRPRALGRADDGLHASPR